MSSRGKYTCHEHDSLVTSASTIETNIETIVNQFENFYNEIESFNWIAPAKGKLISSKGPLSEVLTNIRNGLNEITQVCGLIADYKNTEAEIERNELEKQGVEASIEYWQSVLANDSTRAEQANNELLTLYQQLGRINTKIQELDAKLDSLVGQIG